jgi:hypothetical protein
MVTIKDDDNIPSADGMVRGTQVYASGRIDIPLFNRRTLRDAAEELHQLANALTRYSLNPPGEILSDATALGMARTHVRATNARMLLLKKRDADEHRRAVAEHKRANVVKFGVERKTG